MLTRLIRIIINWICMIPIHFLYVIAHPKGGLIGDYRSGNKEPYKVTLFKGTEWFWERG
jgi:hypothetical protein